ncbi:hypothetical protein [Demequina zhanjiangensis]|uniref:DUF4179 domain-containing protein n=1 Tax=Demequina zhanjiangensis TaxID=3051659 RepID=A0ABT8G3U7_9MICO|nr:hypothetical protein [Demequina sp. SYSU T00b26]MDN4473798.1 hypothetical protein [Demequina sp. SYSU T00b26]
MDRIESMLSDAFEDDAARFGETTFIEQHAEAVTSRVRRRRRTKAAGYSALGVAAVAAVAIPMLPTYEESLTPADMPACVPFDSALEWWETGTGDEDFLSGQSQSLYVELSAERLRVSRPNSGDEPLVIPIENRLLEGTTSQGEALHLEFESGASVDVWLTWADDVVELSVTEDGDLGEMRMSTGPGVWDGRYDMVRTGADRYFGFPFGESDWSEWHLYDVGVRTDAVTITRDADGRVEVVFPGGSSREFDPGDDGFATFEWVGVAVVEVAVGEEPWVRLHDLEDLSQLGSDVDARMVGPQYCLPDDAPTTTAVDPPAEVSPDATYTVEFDG